MLIEWASWAYSLVLKVLQACSWRFKISVPGLTGAENDLGSDGPPPGESNPLERDLGGDSWDQGSSNEGERKRTVAWGHLRAPLLLLSALL